MGGDSWRKFVFSSGVEVEYGPFPHGMYWDVMSRLLDEHPDPEPPKKEIEVLQGTELADDLDDPGYRAALLAARVARSNGLADVALEFAVRVDLDAHEGMISRASRFVADPPPEDPEGRKLWFLKKLAIRVPADWEIVGKVQRFSQIEDEEVERKVEFFRGDVAGAEGAEPDAPGAAEV